MFFFLFCLIRVLSFGGDMTNLFRRGGGGVDEQ